MAVRFERSRVLYLECDCCSPFDEGWRLTPEYRSDWYYVEHCPSSGEVVVLGKGSLPEAMKAAIRAHDNAVRARLKAASQFHLARKRR